MSLISVFEAGFIPRFEGEEADKRRLENIHSQQTFWTAVQDLLSTPRPGTHDTWPALNVRFIAEPAGKITRTLLSTSGVPEKDDGLEALRRLLPANYGWRPRSQDALCFSSPGIGSEPAGWFVARVERRVSFVDLPWQLPESEDTSGPGTPAGDASPRQLITEIASEADLQMERLCLPMLGALEIIPSGYRLLFQELRELAPCVVNISVASADRARIDSYRRAATFWDAYLRQFGADIAGAGFAQEAQLRTQFGRFLLPERFLCAATIRVAAPTAAAARAVGIHVSARLGGLRSFVIRTPVQLPLSSLEDPWHDVPHRSRWSAEMYDTRFARLRRELQADGIETVGIERMFEEFLTELPHLYSIDEVMNVASLPVSDEDGLPGMDTRPVPPFSDVSRTGAYPFAAPPPEQRIRVGLMGASSSRGSESDTDGPSGGEWHTLAPDDLTKHAFVVGSTGSGKTVTTLFVVRELARLGIPFLIVEPVKTEYYSALAPIPAFNLRRRRLEGTRAGVASDDFLAFDPMRLQDGVSVARHASYLKSCFEAAFPLEPVLAMILDAGIRAYYTDPSEWGCRLNIFSRGGASAHRVEKYRVRKDGKEEVIDRVHPSLQGFKTFFLKRFLSTVVVAKEGQGRLAELQEQWRQIFQRRFDALTGGMIGVAADKADARFVTDRTQYDPFSELLSGRTVLELDGVPDDEHKALMMAFIMTFLFERRQADDLALREEGGKPEDKLRHVLIVEEAHRILANAGHGARGDLAGMGAQAKSVSLFVAMLAEIRAYGQGLIIVEQIPTKIVPEAVKNTNLKIMLRLTASDDREFLGSAMNFTDEQKRFVMSLRAQAGRGVDMVVFEQQLDQPRLLYLPLRSADGPIHAGLFPDREAAREA